MNIRPLEPLTKEELIELVKLEREHIEGILNMVEPTPTPTQAYKGSGNANANANATANATLQGQWQWQSIGRFQSKSVN